MCTPHKKKGSNLGTESGRRLSWEETRIWRKAMILWNEKNSMLLSLIWWKDLFYTRIYIISAPKATKHTHRRMCIQRRSRQRGSETWEDVRKRAFWTDGLNGQKDGGGTIYLQFTPFPTRARARIEKTLFTRATRAGFDSCTRRAVMYLLHTYT